MTNSPITALLIAFELFDFNGMPYYCVVVAVCYLLSGYFSLYHEQRIMYSKTENRYRSGAARHEHVEKECIEKDVPESNRIC